MIDYRLPLKCNNIINHKRSQEPLAFSRMSSSGPSLCVCITYASYLEVDPQTYLARQIIEARSERVEARKSKRRTSCFKHLLIVPCMKNTRYMFK